MSLAGLTCKVEDMSLLRILCLIIVSTVLVVFPLLATELESYEGGVSALKIITYAPDGMIITDEKILNVSWMKEHLPVLGNGETVYSFEGPEVNSTSNEIAYNGRILNSSESVKGTSLKALVDFGGGIQKNGQIRLISTDGTMSILPYEAVYLPPSVQGEAILAWYTREGGESNEYLDGLRLFFLPDDKVFNNSDMEEAFEEKYWKYAYSGLNKYPSALLMTQPRIDTMEIYPSLDKYWDLRLKGVYDITFPKDAFETMYNSDIRYQGIWNDSEGNVWSGVPLWRLISLVDDEDDRTGLIDEPKFNDNLLNQGYNVTINGADGRKVELQSDMFAYNDRIILAEFFNGEPISHKDPDFPLLLCGEDITEDKINGGIWKIEMNL